MKILKLVLVLLVLTPYALAQELMHIDRSKMCSWNEDAVIPEDLYSFPPDAATKEAVAKIMKYTGLEVNFDVVAANVPNAVATMQNGKRLKMFNRNKSRLLNLDPISNSQKRTGFYDPMRRRTGYRIFAHHDDGTVEETSANAEISWTVHLDG